MKTAISIPDPLFRQLEQMRRRLKLSRSELIARAVERFIAELNQPDVRTMTDDEITKAVDRSLKRDSPLDPGLKALQDRALCEDW